MCYSSFSTILSHNKLFSFWYFPGAIFFTFSIILTIIGIIYGTKWLNIILQVINANCLFYLSFLLLFV
ncbi:hypothetical protein CD132_11830 [Staphylococcus microti]|nr:hypothetical protein CD132_11830 [Staphylococcus microti]